MRSIIRTVTIRRLLPAPTRWPLLAACMLLVCRADAFALNSSLDVSQYAHTAWKTAQGFSEGLIRSIAQTPDGYLWLGGAALTSDPSAITAAIEVEVDGQSRDLNPVVREEAYRIVGEAVRNAFKHAQARHIIVTIHYDAQQLRLTIRDDGKGMDEETIRRQQPTGHFGLPGMRERAAIVRGRLEVRSAMGFGTEIELRIPAAIAYGPSAPWWL
jgi:hypothetical protein